MNELIGTKHTLYRVIQLYIAYEYDFFTDISKIMIIFKRLTELVELFSKKKKK